MKNKQLDLPNDGAQDFGMTLLVVLALFVILDLLAVRFGTDSRQSRGWSVGTLDEWGEPHRT